MYGINYIKLLLVDTILLQHLGIILVLMNMQILVPLVIGVFCGIYYMLLASIFNGV